MSEYIGIAICFVMAGVITGAMVVLASTLGKKVNVERLGGPATGEQQEREPRMEQADQSLPQRGKGTD